MVGHIFLKPRLIDSVLAGRQEMLPYIETWDVCVQDFLEIRVHVFLVPKLENFLTLPSHSDIFQGIMVN